IDFVVTDQGVPTRITVVTQTHPAFGRAASVAVAKWRFSPAVKDGRSVNASLRVPVIFQLEETGLKKPVFDKLPLPPIPSGPGEPARPPR
ncbi:MAG: hypothetical protein RLZZ15_2784, partial [Verrucomicrobiota bacterium]